MDVPFIINQLREQADANYLAGMQRFGIDNTTALATFLLIHLLLLIKLLNLAVMNTNL